MTNATGEAVGESPAADAFTGHTDSSTTGVQLTIASFGAFFFCLFLFFFFFFLWGRRGGGFRSSSPSGRGSTPPTVGGANEREREKEREREIAASTNFQTNKSERQR